MTEVVVGVDGSDVARMALRWAVDDGRARGLPVRAVLAWRANGGHRDSDAAPAPPGGYYEAAASALHDLVSGLGSAAEGVEIIEDVADGDPTDALLERTREGILVVGARGRGPVRRLVLGSVSQSCLHHAHVPVVVVRQRPPHAMLERPVLVGVDGSEASVAAVRFAAEEAAARRVRLKALHAWNVAPAPYAAGYLPVSEADLQRAGQRIADDSIERGLAGGPRVDVYSEVASGPAASLLLSAAADAQLLVVGSHGHGRFAEALVGSTSHRCTLHSPCPVAVVCPW